MCDTGLSRKEKVLFLSRYAEIKNRVVMLIERKSVYQDAIYGVKSPNLDGMPHGGTKTDISDKVIQCMSITKEIDNELDMLCDRLEKIKAVIGNVDDYNERSILEMKYIDGLSYRQLRTITDSSLKTIQRRLVNSINHMMLSKQDYDYVMTIK